MDMEKDLMAIILVMAIRTVNTWELKHHKKEIMRHYILIVIITCRGYKVTVI